MADAFDAQAFAFAIELANQLSSTGAFIDDFDEHTRIFSYNVDTNHMRSEAGACSSLRILAGCTRNGTVVGVVASPVDASAEIRSSSSVAWWSLIDRAADISSDDLLAINWQ
uniref:Uncharacterized protein n=1 Tax=Peronospora matthiolae TaxID=2874970 RepID=A0AAV1UCT7_9STRA